MGEGQTVDRRQAAIIITAGIPSSLSFSLLMPVLPKIQEAMAHGPDDGLMVRLVFSIVGIAMLFGSPISGFLFDRMGPRRLMIGGLGIWTAIGIGNFFVTSLELLVVSRFVQALAGAAAMTVGLAMLGAVRDDIRRSRMAGVQVMISTLSGLVALIVAGVVGDIDWRYVFLLHALAIPLWLLSFTIPSQEAGIAAPAQDYSIASLRRLPFAYAALALLTGSVVYSTATYMPFRFHDLGVTSAKLIGLSLTAETVTLAVTAALFGWGRRFLSPSGAFAIAFVLTATGAAIAALSNSYAMALIGLLVLGLGAGWLAPNLMTIVAGNAAAHERGRQVGFVKGFHFAAALVASLALEPVVRWGGPAAAMVSIAMVSAIAALVSAVIALAASRRAAMPCDNAMGYSR